MKNCGFCGIWAEFSIGFYLIHSIILQKCSLWPVQTVSGFKTRRNVRTSSMKLNLITYWNLLTSLREFSLCHLPKKAQGRVTLLLSRRFIKTHWTNTRITNKKMTIHWFHSIAIQHKYQNHNTALSSLSVNARHTSASLRWTVKTNASHAVHLLQQRCLVSGSFFF